MSSSDLGSEAPTTPAGMNFAIRYLTEYEYDGEVVDNLNALRVKPLGNDRQRCDEFSVRLTPEVRLHRHADYFGTEVVEFEVSRPHRQLTIDVRARVSTKAAVAPPESSWEGLKDPAYREAGGEFLLQTDSALGHPRLPALLEATRADSPLQTVLTVAQIIPDTFEYDKATTFVDSTVTDLLEAGAGSARTSSTSGSRCCATTGSPRATCPGTCTHPEATTAVSRSRSTPTPGWRRCSRSPIAIPSGSGPTPPTAVSPARPT